MILDAGFRQDGVLVVNLDVRGANIPPQGRRDAFNALASRLATIPGVDTAAEAFIIPISGSGWNNRIVIDGTPQQQYVNFNSVGPGYFRTMATPMLAGRDFSEHDTINTAKVAIVTETFAKKHFGGQNPVGKRFQIEEGVGVERPVYEIVGFVKDAKYTDLREEFMPIAFLAASQDKELSPSVQIALRSALPLTTLTAQVSAVVLAVQPMAILNFQTMNSMVRDSLLRERLMAMLSGFFGLLAGLLATIGLYGVMAYMVERRRNEIGIRMALGAGRGTVVAMVMREAMTLLVAGLVVGGLAAVGAARWASTLLFGLKPSDPLTLIIAIVALSTVAALASYVPAWRASHLEPTAALREE
jgi:predicted permease